MLTGFGIQGFRSYGPDPQLLGNLAKINVFVGQNNVGKSNLLQAVRLAALVANGAVHPFAKAVKPSDAHQGRRSSDLQVFLPVPLAPDTLEEYLDRFKRGTSGLDDSTRRRIESIIRALPFQKFGQAWFAYSLQDTKFVVRQPVADDFERDGDKYGDVSSADWSLAWSILTGSQGGNILGHWIPQTLAALSPSGRTPAGDVYYVEAHRKIGEPGTDFQGLNGVGLIGHLRSLQSPKAAVRDASKAKFSQINSFLKSVSGFADAHIEVDGDATELMVNVNGVVRKIEDLGTGIHEVVILAVAASSVEDSIMCIEEPEIHLHPRIQRRLLQFLMENTSNQYFVTTHSAHMLDCPGAALFHLRLNDQLETVVEPLSAEHRATACFDLGYRASDLVQANCIVWVEGPSDRCYVNAWLSMAAPELREGLHYSVMFYGGRLLNHLTVSDAAVTEFIELQRLNRNVAVIVDSDKRKAADKINSTKERVREEVLEHGGFAWITAGREIENYVPEDVIQAALLQVHPRSIFQKAANQWAVAYRAHGEAGLDVDKLKVAKQCVSSIHLNVLDLRERIEALAQFIRRANE